MLCSLYALKNMQIYDIKLFQLLLNNQNIKKRFLFKVLHLNFVLSRDSHNLLQTVTCIPENSSFLLKQVPNVYPFPKEQVGTDLAFLFTTNEPTMPQMLVKHISTS